MCLAVTCHLHLWQNDRDLLGATAVIRGCNGFRYPGVERIGQHKKLTLEKKILPPLLRGSNPGPFDHESDALTTELFPLPSLMLMLKFVSRVLLWQCGTSPPTFTAVPSAIEAAGTVSVD